MSQLRNSKVRKQHPPPSEFAQETLMIQTGGSADDELPQGRAVT